MSRNKIRFAAFEVDPQSGELRKHGLRIKLQDQPFKILVALLEKPGEVVSREELRERVWGNDTFVDFNHGLSAAVNRLRDALSDSAENPRYVETMARRGYRFIAQVEGSSKPVSPEAETPKVVVGPTHRRLIWAIVGSLTIAGVVGVGIWLMQVRGVPATTPRLVQVTSLIGSETMPTFSPDGTEVAFVWNGEKEDDANIYVKMVGSETALRLTTDPGADLLPSWSPDGRQIAFVRIHHGMTGIYLVSPLGGPERKLVELPGLDRRPAGPETKIVGDLLYPTMNRPSWSADGKFMAVTKFSEPLEPGDGAVLLVPVDGGEPRPMLVPQPGTWYRHAAFSPDGRSLAVARYRDGKCQLEIMRLSPELLPQGEPRTVLSDCKQLRGLAWMPDGESLVVSGFNLPHFFSWRVSASKFAEPERIEMAGADAIWPAISRSGGRLAFAHSILQADLWRLDQGNKPYSFLSSTTRENFPQFSPDGRRIAFQSGRAGANDIWVAQADGTELVQITRDLGGMEAPTWSPDGKWIAFSGGKQESNVWIVESSGSPSRQLTQGPGEAKVPSWSSDGKRIYFKSNRSGRAEIWRMLTEGGAAEQITRNGGFLGFESADGKTLYYTKSDQGNEGIFSLPLSGGKEKLVIAEEILRRSFTVVPEGIYYIAPRDEKTCEIRFYQFASGHKQVVAEIDRPVAFGLSVSPNRKTFLYSRPGTGSDLMMIENFR